MCLDGPHIVTGSLPVEWTDYGPVTWQPEAGGLWPPPPASHGGPGPRPLGHDVTVTSRGRARVPGPRPGPPIDRVAESARPGGRVYGRLSGAGTRPGQAQSPGGLTAY
jgi:hypothetical protein